MSDIERPDLQSLVNRMQAEVSASKVRGCINAARVIWRDFDLVTGTHNALIVDPTKGRPSSTSPKTASRIGSEP